MKIGIDVVFGQAGIHVFLVQANALEFAERVFQGWNSAGCIQVDVLSSRNKGAILELLEVSHAFACGGWAWTFFESDRYVQSCFRMRGHQITATVGLDLIDINLESA